MSYIESYVHVIGKGGVTITTFFETMVDERHRVEGVCFFLRKWLRVTAPYDTHI